MTMVCDPEYIELRMKGVYTYDFKGLHTNAYKHTRSKTLFLKGVFLSGLVPNQFNF